MRVVLPVATPGATPMSIRRRLTRCSARTNSPGARVDAPAPAASAHLPPTSGAAAAAATRRNERGRWLAVLLTSASARLLACGGGSETRTIVDPGGGGGDGDGHSTPVDRRRGGVLRVRLGDCGAWRDRRHPAQRLDDSTERDRGRVR